MMMINSCANLPTQYGSWVIIKVGKYKGYLGTLFDDCSGFENYRVYIPKKKVYNCYRIWELEEY